MKTWIIIKKAFRTIWKYFFEVCNKMLQTYFECLSFSEGNNKIYEKDWKNKEKVLKKVWKTYIYKKKEYKWNVDISKKVDKWM